MSSSTNDEHYTRGWNDAVDAMITTVNRVRDTVLEPTNKEEAILHMQVRLLINCLADCKDIQTYVAKRVASIIPEDNKDGN